MRKASNTGLLVFTLCALAMLWLAPAAEACCTPCDPWCNVFLGPNDYCCTGIPEPGNACGLTICAKWKEENGYDRTALSDLFKAPELSLFATGNCPSEVPAFVAQADTTEPAAEPEEAIQTDR